MKIAVVAGATGLVGKQCMFKLLETVEYYKVIALVRKPLEISHPKLEQVVVDYDHLASLQISDKVTDVFCCLGTTMKQAGSKEAFYKVDFTYVDRLAKYFSDKGAVNFMLVSATMADKNSSVYYSRVKGEVEAAVQQYAYKGVFIFRPAVLLGNRQQFRFGERVGIAIALLVQPFLIGSFKKYRPIYGAVVAQVMIKASLQNKEGSHVLESDDIAAFVA